MSESDSEVKTDALKEREIYLELAKLAQASFFNRRSYEWKVAFGLWAAIGAWTYFAVDKADKIKFGDYGLLFIAAGYVVIVLAYFFLWQVPIRRAFEHDKAVKHVYFDCAEGKKPRVLKFDTYIETILKPSSVAYVIGQTFFTAVFLVGSFVAIYASAKAAGAAEKEAKNIKGVIFKLSMEKAL